MFIRKRFYGPTRRVLLTAFAAAPLAAGALLTVTALATIERFRPADGAKTDVAKPVAHVRRPAQDSARTHTDAAVSTGHIRRAQLWPQLRESMNVLGDRLEKPGKERLTFTGTFQAAGDADPTALALIREFPDRLRLERQHGAGRVVTVFDGSKASRSGGMADEIEEGVIEALVFDAADYFFLAHANGGAIRHLGDRFRPEGASEDYAGPFHNLYEVSFGVSTRGKSVARSKTYCFNSTTRLLEAVRYTVERGGYEVRVEVRFSDWQQYEGQRVPGRVMRLEDNQPVWSLTLAMTGVGARSQDGTFAHQ